jgi:hypothetical protein
VSWIIAPASGKSPPAPAGPNFRPTNEPSFWPGRRRTIRRRTRPRSVPARSVAAIR